MDKNSVQKIQFRLYSSTYQFCIITLIDYQWLHKTRNNLLYDLIFKKKVHNNLIYHFIKLVTLSFWCIEEYKGNRVARHFPPQLI